MFVSIRRQAARKQPAADKHLSWNDLRRAAKKQGLKIYGKTREQLENEVQF
jgi:hypothetical protein